MRFLGKKKIWWLSLSIVLALLGILAVFIWKLPLGIDFRGGALFEIQFAKPVAQDQLRAKLETYQEAHGVTVSAAGENDYLIKTLPITDSEKQGIENKLKTDFGSITVKQFQSVGPSVSKDLTNKAGIAVVLASLLILFYLAYAFRKVTQPVSSWRFGAVAIVALLHDLIISVGVFAIVAHFLHYEVDASFITALLTIMGFSVHDTIVVFDRLRENLMHANVTTGQQFEQIADQSLSETLNRSLATSLTVLFTLTALTILGGSSIRPFVVTLLIGIFIGTYSSIFTATPLLTIWQNRVFNTFK